PPWKPRTRRIVFFPLSQRKPNFLSRLHLHIIHSRKWRCPIKKINELVVKAGHALEPKAIAAVRGDTFVVETNIHYPTESTLIGDGLRKILPLAAEIAAANGLEGWRQHEHVLRKVRKLVHAIGRASRAQGRGADRLKPGYRKLLELAEDLLARARRLLGELAFVVPEAALTVAKLRNAVAPGQRENLLFHY